MKLFGSYCCFFLYFSAHFILFVVYVQFGSASKAVSFVSTWKWSSHSHTLDKSNRNEADWANKTTEKERPIKQAHISIPTMRIVRIAILTYIHHGQVYSWFFLADLKFLFLAAAVATLFSHYTVELLRFERIFHATVRRRFFDMILFFAF